jgi:hypothetical protein
MTTATSNSIGFSVLGSTEVWVAPQSKSYSTGIHVGSISVTTSANVHITSPRVSSATNGGNNPNDGDTFPNGSISCRQWRCRNHRGDGSA